MTNILTIISPTTLAEAKELATTLSNANSMPAALKKSPADVLAIVMAGAELGLAPMQSIRGIMLIDGRPTLSADAMGALVKASPLCEYLQCTETTDTVATFVTKRKGNPEKTTFSFTIAEAQRAGLVRETQSGKPSNWHKYPKAMLRARALSGICRLEYGDLMLGVYDPDEIEAPAEKQVASVVEPLPTPPQAANLSALKAATKTRRAQIVDVSGTPSPAPETPEDEATIGWGVSAATKLADMKTGALEALIHFAEDAAQKNENDSRDLWVDRLMRYTSALAKRGGTEAAVSP